MALSGMIVSRFGLFAQGRGTHGSSTLRAKSKHGFVLRMYNVQDTGGTRDQSQITHMQNTLPTVPSLGTNFASAVILSLMSNSLSLEIVVLIFMYLYACHVKLSESQQYKIPKDTFQELSTEKQYFLLILFFLFFLITLKTLRKICILLFQTHLSL